MTTYHVTDELTYDSETHECIFPGYEDACEDFVENLQSMVTVLDTKGEDVIEYYERTGSLSCLNYEDSTPDHIEFSGPDPEDNSLQICTYITVDQARDFLKAVK